MKQSYSVFLNVDLFVRLKPVEHLVGRISEIERKDVSMEEVEEHLADNENFIEMTRWLNTISRIDKWEFEYLTARPSTTTTSRFDSL